MPNKNIFITGIGTGVGKTVTSAIFAKATGYAYWKPIQCGDLGYSDAQTVRDFCPGVEIVNTQFNLQAPLSPHAAAKLEQIEIELDAFETPAKPSIIEGAGGALVPLNNRDFIIDLVPRFDASVVVVSQFYLGSINHTLLTLNEIKRRGLHVLGIVFNDNMNIESKELILEHHNLPVLLEVPFHETLSASQVATHAEQLKRMLQ